MPNVCHAADHHYYHTTGFHDHEITELAASVHPFLARKTSWHGRNPRLGLFKQVALEAYS
jgi:hypothetical protein